MPHVLSTRSAGTGSRAGTTPSVTGLGVDLGEGAAATKIIPGQLQTRMETHGTLKDRSRSAENAAEVFVQPPTPDASLSLSTPSSSSVQSQDSTPSSALSSIEPVERSPSPKRTTAISDSPASSMSSIPSSSSLLSLTVHNQVLPEVRSPPKKNTATLESTLIDSLTMTSRRSRRPRLFGFTEMRDGDGSGDSQTSSASASVAGSREPSPPRFVNGPSEATAQRFDPSPSRKASDALTFVPRRHAPKVMRTQSDLTLSTTAAASSRTSATQETTASQQSKPSTLVNPTLPPTLRVGNGPIRPTLSTRTSAQRNESALKLDLQGLKSSQGLSTTGTQTSPSTLIRKKSGEILKPSLKSVSSFTSLDGKTFSASLGTKSAPSTPSLPKYVHFDAQLERVKLFLKEQKPQVVSRDGTPADYTTSEGEEFPFPSTDEEPENVRRQLEIRLPNFPTHHQPGADLYLEALFLDDDRKTLKGIVRVKNLAFEKWVAVRFTFDWWQTTSEVTATHKESLKGGEYDRFHFSLKLHDILPKIEEKSLFIALRYTAGGREIWDNNGGSNYQVNFLKVKPVNTGLTAARPSISAGSGMISAGQGRAIGGRSSQWSLHHGQQQDRMADLRMQLSRLTDDELGTSPSDKTASVRERAAALTASYAPGSSSPNLSQKRRAAPPGTLAVPRKADSNGESALLSPLGARYDFGSAWHGGKKTSPKLGAKDLPEPNSPGGLRFNSDATVGPTYEFYSPQLDRMDLPSTYTQSPPKKETAALPGMRPAPAVKVEVSSPSSPSPPPAATKVQSVDYFSSAAPAATTTPRPAAALPATATSPEISRTALPRMYSAPPVPIANQRSGSSDSLSSVEGVWVVPRRFDARDQVASSNDNVEVSPPSISSSITSLASSASPMSPPQPQVTMWSPEKAIDVAHIDYSNFIQQFCWGGGNMDNNQTAKAPLDGRRNHSTSDVDKFYSTVGHWPSSRPKSPDTTLSSGAKTPTVRTPVPIPHQKSQKTTYSNGTATSAGPGRTSTPLSTTPTQSDYDCSLLMESVTRSLQGSPIGTPIASPPRALRSCLA